MSPAVDALFLWFTPSTKPSTVGRGEGMVNPPFLWLTPLTKALTFPAAAGWKGDDFRCPPRPCIHCAQSWAQLRGRLFLWLHPATPLQPGGLKVEVSENFRHLRNCPLPVATPPAPAPPKRPAVAACALKKREAGVSPGLSLFASERRNGVTRRHGKHEGEQRQPLYFASALMPRCRHAP